MLDDTTEIVNMNFEVDLEECETAAIIKLTPDNLKKLKIKNLCCHGRTMLMMYQATKEECYLKRARSDIRRARSIKVGFFRPLGVLLAS